MDELHRWDQAMTAIVKWMKSHARPVHQKAFADLHIGLIADWRKAVVDGWCKMHHPNLQASWSENGTTLIIECKFPERVSPERVSNPEREQPK